ncbi:MAG: hypothetical protein ACYC9Q_14640 [Bacillota bacterium]
MTGEASSAYQGKEEICRPVSNVPDESRERGELGGITCLESTERSEIVAKIVCYDLLKPGQDYSSLIAELQKYPKWARVTESTWAISTNQGCVAVRDHLRQYMDANDRLFVGALAGEAAWAKVKCTDEMLKDILNS